MRPFEYVRPSSLKEALALMSAHGTDARLLAGGTDLIVQMQKRGVSPKLVIDIKGVKELATGIETSATSVRIGARVTMAQLTRENSVRRYFPALAEAARVVGSLQIRSRATVAGNLANASPAADTVPALLIYGATVHTAGTSGTRAIPLEQFLVGPGKTQLKADEIITSIDIMPGPKGPGLQGSAFLRLTRRKGIDLAIVSVACLVARDGLIRIACGAVAPVPFVIETNDRTAAIEQVLERAQPISDIRGSREYRSSMLRVLVRRALEEAERRCA